MDIPASEGLECGASLAEGEFCDVIERRNLRKPSIESIRKEGTTYDSIDDLRSSLVKDLITTKSVVVNKNNEGNGIPHTTFASPFSLKSESNTPFQLPCVYCDHTASNKSVASMEQYLQQACLPFYANTHTNTSVTGSQSTAFVAEARQIVAEETNAKITGKASQDVVLFTGSGATSAVELLIDCLGLRHAVAAAASGNQQDQPRRPVVFVGPYEHHSNLVNWRETGCEVVMVPECPRTKSVDMQALETVLQSYQTVNVLKMGTFSAASNVTGKLSDTHAIASMLHKYGCLAFFDYATSAPYVEMNMNPTPSHGDEDPTKDAMFLSPHKMLGGGAGTPGVLIVKKRLVSQSNAPNKAGGGTVFYVTKDHHRFLSNRLERYEGGTPHVAGIWRVGLCFLLKRRVQREYAKILQKQQVKNVSEEEEEEEKKSTDSFSDSAIPPTVFDFDISTYHMVASYLKKHAPKLILLGYDPSLDGNGGSRNLPIFSFLIRFGKRFLHYNYVCAVLNDLFGIQSRGGCQCAGPYSQHLLGLTSGDDGRPSDTNAEIEHALVQYKERAELLRPGYTRLSLPFKGLTSKEVQYVVKALVWVSEKGWELMCQYRCNHRTGEWRHAARQGKPLGKEERRWLSHYDSLANSVNYQCATDGKQAGLGDIFEQTLGRADAVLAEARRDQRSIAQTLKMTDADSVLGNEEGGANLETLRWYVYPKECAVRLSERNDDVDIAIAQDDELLGAINPSRVCPEVSSEDAKHDKKRKMGDPDEKGRGSGMPSLMPTRTILSFRDGDHQGDAEMNEIEQGIADGELSAATEVFDSRVGEWRQATQLFSLNKKPKTTDAAPTGTNHEKHDVHKKKAQRDQSTWGQGRASDVATVSKPANISEEEASSKVAKEKELSAGKKKRMKHIRPPAKLMRSVTQAVFQWEMIQDGDKLLLGLSGGKDSMSLLHCLMELKRKLPAKFEIEVCTIDPLTPSFDPSPLVPYVESLGLKYHYVKDDIVARAASAGKDGKMVSSLCAYCARMKRGNLYNVARRNKCNKLVLAQHLDDCAESFMMSVMHNGFLRTMKANYEINAGDLSVIRPMVYCRESLMTEFAKSAKLPIINENCPACFEEPKERARVKKLLSREELSYPNFYDCIKRSMIPLMHPLSEAVMHSFTEEAVARSRKKGVPAKHSKKQEASSRSNEDAASGKVTPGEASKLLETNESALSTMTDEDLMAELARRKAAKYRLAGAMKRTDETGESARSGTSTMLCEIGGACSHFD